MALLLGMISRQKAVSKVSKRMINDDYIHPNSIKENILSGNLSVENV